MYVCSEIRNRVIGNRAGLLVGILHRIKLSFVIGSLLTPQNTTRVVQIETVAMFQLSKLSVKYILRFR